MKKAIRICLGTKDLRIYIHLIGEHFAKMVVQGSDSLSLSHITTAKTLPFY